MSMLGITFWVTDADPCENPEVLVGLRIRKSLPTPTFIFREVIVTVTDIDTDADFTNAAKSITKIFFKKICFGTINFVKITSNLFTKQIPSHALLQKTGTNQWQQHYKENYLVEYFL